MKSGDCEVIRVDFAKKEVLGRDKLTLPTKNTANKLDLFQRLIENSLTTVIVNTKDFIVQVPDEYQNVTDLQLSWSYKFGLPDFEFDNKSIRGSLSFGGQSFYVIVPWDSITGMFQPNIKGNEVFWFHKLTEEGKHEPGDAGQILGANLKARAREAVLKGVKIFLGSGKNRR